MMVNTCLETIGETPLTKQKLQREIKHSKQKIEKVTAMMQNAGANDQDEMIRQLKEKFPTVGRSVKMLSCLKAGL